MIYLISILFTLAFIIYSKYQFDDEKAGWNNSKGKWHPYGFIMRVLFFVGLLVYKYFPFDYWDLLIAGAINIILWDIGINVFALKVKWNYEGETSSTDKKLGKSKWYVYACMLIGSITGKIFSKNKNKKT
jgi:hypothetical protein